MLMSGDQVPAPKAQLWGLVEYVVDTLDEGIEQFGGGLASLSPFAMRELRQLLRDTRDAPSYERELEAFTRCLQAGDGREGVAAFLEKREPAGCGLRTAGARRHRLVVEFPVAEPTQSS